jgi:hypothetical protein
VLASGKYVSLRDTKHIFGFQNVAPVVKKSLVSAGGSTFTSTVNAVSATLTNQAMIAMNKAVAIDKDTGRGRQGIPDRKRPGLASTPEGQAPVGACPCLVMPVRGLLS